MRLLIIVAVTLVAGCTASEPYPAKQITKRKAIKPVASAAAPTIAVPNPYAARGNTKKK